MNSIEKRLNRLERETKLWRVAGMALAAGLLIMATTCGTTSIETEEFTLTDADGNVKASILVDEDDGMPGVFLYDEDVEVRAMMTMREGGDPGVILFDSRGDLRLALDLTDDLPGLHLYDSRGNIRGMFTVFDDGDAGLAFFDSDGEVIWAAP